MSTLALLGLLVVLLVAIGIAGFLLRGRRGSSADPDAPPRTVAELVDRRRAEDGEPDDGTETATGPIRSEDPGAAAPPSGAAVAGAGADTTAGPSADAAAAAPVGDGTAGSGRDAVAASGVDTPAPSGGSTITGPGVRTAPGSGDTDGPDAPAPDDGSEDTDTAPLDGPSTPRPGSDADTGPSSPPWSRGFVEGRQITPPPARTAEPGQESVEAEAERPSPPPRQESRSPVDPDLVKRVTSPVPSATGRRTSDPDTEREFREARDRMAGPAVVRHSPVPEQASRSPESVEPSPSPRPRPSPGTRPGDEDTADRSDRGGSAGAVAAGTAAAAVAISRSGSTDEDVSVASDTSPAARTSPIPRAVERPSSGPGDEPPPRPSPRVMRSAGPMVAGPGVADQVGDDPVGEDRAGVGTEGPGRHPEAAEPEQVVAFTGSPPLRLRPVPSTPVQDVDVHVSDRSERPLAGVALSAVDGAGSPAGSGTTGADGDARLRAPGAGQYLLVASVDGYQTRVAPYAVADGPVRVPVTLARSSSLRGIVRGPAGEPRAGLSVSLGQDGAAVARTDTGSDGTYRFADLPAGHYLLAAGERPGATVHVPPEADVEQDVRSNGTESV